MSRESEGGRLRVHDAVKKNVSAETCADAHPKFGSWQDAEALRKWSFARRTPQQRLDWLVAALSIAYETGALRATPPPAADPDNSLK